MSWDIAASLAVFLLYPYVLWYGLQWGWALGCAMVNRSPSVPEA